MAQSKMMLLCELVKSENSEFHFVLHEGSHAAIDIFADQIEQLQLEKKWYNTGHILLLVDASEDQELAMRYLLETLGDYNRSYGGLIAPSVTLAVVHHPQTEIPDVYHMFASLLEPPVKVKYFTDLPDAQAWLV